MNSQTYLELLDGQHKSEHAANCESQRIPNSELIHWTTTRANRMRPVTFRPNGSFRTLVQIGKLNTSATLQHDNTNTDASQRQQMSQRKQYMPGYTGFVRGAQHISGRSYGETTRRAMDTDYREHVCTSPIPSAPQNNRKIRQIQPPTSFVTHQFAGKRYMVPGYTGHVPGVRTTYAKTYGSSTTQEMLKNSLRLPRLPSTVPKGYADTSRPRQVLPLSSAPLAGSAVERAPVKLVPSHLKQLRFFGN